MPIKKEIVLLVEDDAGIVELIREKLDELGLQTAHVATGRAAIEWLQHNHPPGNAAPVLLLLDQSLPDIPGLELVEKLTATPGGMPPFIVTTGAGDERLAVTMMKHGAKDYLIKDRHFLDALPVVVEHILKQLATEHQLADAQQALLESETKLRLIVEKSHDAIGVSKDGIHVLANPAYATLFGYNRGEELVGLPILQLIAPESHSLVLENIQRRANGEAGPASYEVVALRKDSTTFIMEVTASRYTLQAEAYTLVLLRDITERKQAEEKLRIALQEKEVLLRELYHRTKNNMQVISAMLSLEAARSENETLQKTFRDMDTRIHSMALVHQKLYQSHNLSSIDLKDYISDLAHLLVQTYQTTPGQVTLNLELESVLVLIDSAIPCGLIVNETISNALKYAFPGGRTGEIQIHIARTPENMILLEISDNGIGIPPAVDLRQSNTLGMQTIFGIAGHQLGAQVEVVTVPGVAWRILFSDNQYRPRV